MEDPIIIGDKEYKFADLPPIAQRMVTFIHGQDVQLDKLDEQMEQIKICREGCFFRLQEAMKDVEQEKPAATG